MDTCSTCLFHSGPPGVKSGRRECRALPPSMGIEVQYPGRPYPVVLGAWPLTLPTDHCGGHEPIPAALPAPPVVESKPRPAPKAKPDP